MNPRAVVMLICLFAVPSLGQAGEPEIVQLSPDTYMISKEDHGGIFGNASNMKTKIIKQANAFAAKQGKVAIPLASNERPMGNGPAQWASFEYQFRVVDPNDPEARRTSLAPIPDTVVAVQIAPNPAPAAPAAPPATLPALRKRGLISDAEFEAQKRKVLEAALRR